LIFTTTLEGTHPSGFFRRVGILIWDGLTREQHDWVKCHLMCGVKTNIVTAVEIHGPNTNDSKILPALAATTAQNLKMADIERRNGPFKTTTLAVPRLESDKVTRSILGPNQHLGLFYSLKVGSLSLAQKLTFLHKKCKAGEGTPFPAQPSGSLLRVDRASE
jgi:hypothetical protein